MFCGGETGVLQTTCDLDSNCGRGRDCGVWAFVLGTPLWRELSEALLEESNLIGMK